MEQPRSPEADVLAEKTARAIAAFDTAQHEVHKALDLLEPDERESVGTALKATLQMALVTRLCHMTIGGMAMTEQQVNAIALDLLQELNGLAKDLQKDAVAAERAAGKARKH
jgi:hypothetical protein